MHKSKLPLEINHEKERLWSDYLWTESELEHAAFIYHSPGDWELHERLWAVRGGQTTTKPGYKIGPKRIDDYSIHLITEGELLLSYGEQQCLLRSGDLLYVSGDPLYVPKTYTMYITSDDMDCLSWLSSCGLTS